MRHRTRRGWIVACLLGFFPAAPTLQAQENEADSAWRKLIEPSRVTLRLENATWQEAYVKLAEVSGNPLKVAERTPWQARPVTITIKNEPFWKAVELLNKVSPATLDSDHDSPVFTVRNASSPTEYPFVTYVGPAAVSVHAFEAIRESAYTWSFTEGRARGRNPSVRLDLCVAVEPRIRVASGSVRLDQAVDDTGKDLLSLAGGRRGGVAVLSIQRIRQSVREYAQVPISLPAANATALKLLRGSLILGIIPPAEPLRVALDQPGHEISLLGYPITYAKTEGDEKRGWEVTFKAGSWPRSHTIGDTLRGTQLLDAEGKALSYKGFGFRPSDGSRPGTPGFAPGAPVDIHFRFEWQADFKPAALILPAAVPPRSQEFPIEFADIPLPPLTAAYASGETAPPAPAVADSPMPPAPDTVLPMEQLSASTFSLAAEKMPVADAVAEIARQTGNNIVCQTQRLRRGEEPLTLTAALDKAAFWAGLQELCRPGAISLSYSGYEKERRVSVATYYRSAGDPVDAIPPQVVGAVRYAVTAVTVKAESRASYSSKIYTSDKFTLGLTVNAWVEPRINVIQQSGRVMECIGADGTDLVLRSAAEGGGGAVHRPPAPIPDPRAADIPDSTRNSIANIWLSAPLKSGNVPARLARIRVYHYVRIEDKEKTAGPDLVYEWTDLAAGKTYAIGRGLSVVCEQRQWGKDRRLRQFVLTREGGGELTVADTEMFTQGLAAFGDDGKPIKLTMVYGNRNRWALGAPYDAPPVKVTMTVPVALGAYAGVVEFRDVPVPSLPSWGGAN